MIVSPDEQINTSHDKFNSDQCEKLDSTPNVASDPKLNIRSGFSIKIRARPLVKIYHVIFIYVTAPHSESAVLAITHENRALLKMASRFGHVTRFQ